jgi:hypothetical protein
LTPELLDYFFSTRGATAFNENEIAWLGNFA